MDLSPYGANDKRPEAGAEAFARYLYESWNTNSERVSECNEASVLIFLSEEDCMVYIARSPALAPVLSNKRVARLITQMLPLLRQRKYADAILHAIDGMSFYIQYGEPRFWEHFDDRSPHWTGPCWLIAGCLCLYRVSCTMKVRLRRKTSKWSSQHESMHAEMLRNRFKADACPICLGAFHATECGSAETGSDGLPLTLLRCGHVFDATCWTKWVKTCDHARALKCLICQNDVERPLLAVQDS
jgi:hypothetical protein